MKILHTFLLIALSVLFTTTSCSKDDPIKVEKPKEQNVNLVSQFVYDGLSLFYLWENEIIDNKPTVDDNDPSKYFYEILYKADTDNGWSWITDDVEGLLDDFAGTSKTFGFSIGGFYRIDNKIYALVRYVFDNTPASQAGMKRLDLIGEINGQPITIKPGTNQISKSATDVLYGANSASFTTYKLVDSNIVEGVEVEITPEKTNTNPVLYNNIYTIGDKKIGYLFYTNYISNYNDKLFEVFSHFKNEGVTDLVLDLRYNPGGGIDAASYLASLFAPESAVKDKTTLSTLTYNEFWNTYFGSNRNTRLGDYQEEDQYNKDNDELLYKAEPNPLDANLNLNKVYIIATEASASASELTTFCLRAIMGESNVIHIGEQTSGKYTASWTIHPYSENRGRTIPLYEEESLLPSQKRVFKNWAMQPIVAIFTDKNGENFINPGYLEPNYPLEEGFGYLDLWKPLGDPEDVFLGQALYLITGDESYKPTEPTVVRSSRKQVIEVNPGKDDSKPLIIDNIKLSAKDFNEIRESEKLND